MEKAPFRLISFSSEDIPVLWSGLDEMIENGSESWYAHQSKASTFEALMAGKLQFRIFSRGDEPLLYLLTEVRTFPMTRFFHAIWAYGELPPDAVGPLIEALETLAVVNECNGVLVTGRRGWERLLRPQNFKFHSVSLLKPVDRGRLQ